MVESRKSKWALMCTLTCHVDPELGADGDAEVVVDGLACEHLVQVGAGDVRQVQRVAHLLILHLEGVVHQQVPAPPGQPGRRVTWN